MPNVQIARAAMAVVLALCVVTVSGCHNGHRDQQTATPPLATPAPTLTPSVSPSPTSGPEIVSWAPVAYDPAKAPPIPLTIAHPDRTPWCTAAQLTPLVARFQGATGSAAGAVDVRNHATHACALQGVPTVTGYGDKDRVVATPRPQDPFQVHPWIVVAPHAVAMASVQIFGDASRCVGPVRRLAVTIGHDQPPVTVTAGWVSGGDVQPRCGTAAPHHLRDTYDASVGDWRHGNGGPRLPGADAAAELAHVPTTAMQGDILRYLVTLSGIPTAPCLPFRERLLRNDSAVVAEQIFQLDCPAISAVLDPSSDAVTLSMQLALPPRAATGNAELSWDLPVGVSARWDSTIRIVAAPPACTQGQLKIGTGRRGAGLGSFYTPLVFRNISAQPCSLRGYPAVEYVASNGSALPTHPMHGPDVPIRTIGLAPGAAASAMLSGADAGPNGGATPCPATAGLRVIAPGLSTPVLVQPGVDDCEGGRIFVTPVQSGPHPKP